MTHGPSRRVLAVTAAALATTLALGLGPAHAFDTSVLNDKPDLKSVRAKIDAQDYQGALRDLRDLDRTEPDADVYNLLGFTLRKTGDYEGSLANYNKALELQPNHKGAREYLGELYAETGHLDKAREQLAALAALCPTGCEEREDLEQAIRANATH